MDKALADSPAGETSAHDLVVRIARGDPAAEREFAHRFARGIFVLVRRHCRPGDPDVPDLAQDVLTAVIERLRAGAIRDGAALPAYIQVSIVRATTAEYRRRRNAPTTGVELDQAFSDTPDPSDRVDRAQRERAVRQLIDQLGTARDRQVLQRFYIAEQSKEEVCRGLGIDPDHFHRVVFRARQRFRELLLAAGINSPGGETNVASETPS